MKSWQFGEGGGWGAYQIGRLQNFPVQVRLAYTEQFNCDKLCEYVKKELYF